MFRVEFNIETGERREIEQIAYRSTSDPTITIVLDATEPMPGGMEAFDPAAVDTTATDTSAAS